jgi:hypothetical protein
MRGPEKGRYELQGFARGTRGKFRRVRTLTIREDDPHWMAIEVWRLQRSLPGHWRIEVRDRGERGQHRKLAPIVSYEELLRRSKQPQHARTR